MITLARKSQPRKIGNDSGQLPPTIDASDRLLHNDLNRSSLINDRINIFNGTRLPAKEHVS